jgi:hypothetical protein
MQSARDDVTAQQVGRRQPGRLHQILEPHVPGKAHAVRNRHHGTRLVPDDQMTPSTVDWLLDASTRR